MEKYLTIDEAADVLGMSARVMSAGSIANAESPFTASVAACA